MWHLIIEYVDGYAGRNPYYILRRAPDLIDKTGHHIAQTFAGRLDNRYALFEFMFETRVQSRGDKLFGIADTPEEADAMLHQRLLNIINNWKNRSIEVSNATLEDRTKHASKEALTH